MEIREDDLSGEAIRALLRVHFAGMLANSPPGHHHFLDIDGLKSPDVTFWSIWDGERLAGCGALKQLDADHGEVKSMRTDAVFLRRGVGAAMLEHIIGVARARSITRLSLETGTGEAFAAAHRVYARRGFVPAGPFADYRATDFNRFYTLSPL